MFSRNLNFSLGQLSVRHFDSLVALIIVTSTVVWTAIGGKDLNWDQLNYHFYLPYSLFNGRVGLDFLPANGQSYLNPIAYVPFYWMVKLGWHSLLIASILAVIHSANIFLVYKITKVLVPDNNHSREILAILAAALAFLSPIYLMEAGTTFADITTSTLVLGAVFVGLNSDQHIPWWRNRCVVAGLLVGCASAMKLSNLVFAPASVFLVFFGQPNIARGIRASFLLCLGFIAGVAIVHGYWGYILWRNFGNPFLPFFGNFFPSEIFPKQGAPLERFLPDNLLDSILLPFRMALLKAWIHMENVAPDLRFAALVILSLVGLTIWVVRTNSLSTLVASCHLFRSKIASFVIFFVATYIFWLLTSGNGRYGMVVSLLCGPMLSVVAYKLFKRMKIAAYALVILSVLQIIHLSNGDLLWDRGPWTSTWFDVYIPPRLQQESDLYISVGGNSNSYVYPFLSPGSAFTNPIGQISFELNGYVGQQLDKLFTKYAGRIRLISLGPNSDFKLGDAKFEKWYSHIDTQIARLNFGVDQSDCEKIKIAGRTLPIGVDTKMADPFRKTLITCKLYKRPYKFAAERAHIAAVLKKVVASCPRLFKPAYTAPEQVPHGWTSSYPSTDSSIIVTKENEILGIFTRSSAYFGLGTVSQWENGSHPELCESIPSKPREVYTFD